MFVFNTQLIKDKLEQKGWTQTSLADILDVTPATVSYILNNKTKTISLEIAYMICNVLKIEIQELIVDDKPIYISKQEILEQIFQLSSKITKYTKMIKLLEENESD